MLKEKYLKLILNILKKTSKKNLLIKTIYIADSTYATYFTLFENKRRTKEELDQYEEGVSVKVTGRVTRDDFNRGQLCIQPYSITILPSTPPKVDYAKKKKNLAILLLQLLITELFKLFLMHIMLHKKLV